MGHLLFTLVLRLCLFEAFIDGLLGWLIQLTLGGVGHLKSSALSTHHRVRSHRFYEVGPVESGGSFVENLF